MFQHQLLMRTSFLALYKTTLLYGSFDCFTTIDLRSSNLFFVDFPTAFAFATMPVPVEVEYELIESFVTDCCSLFQVLCPTDAGDLK